MQKSNLFLIVIVGLFFVAYPWWVFLFGISAVGCYFVLGKILGAKRWWLPLVIEAGYFFLIFVTGIFSRLF